MTVLPDTVLQRAPNLRLHVTSPTEVRIQVADRTATYPAFTLNVIDVFGRPRTLRDGLDALRVRAAGVQEWMDLSAQTVMLARNGVLVDANAPPAEARTSVTGFDRLALHNGMLNDRVRTARFLDAIAAVVRPGDVVLDIGTGTGVLAMAAARAGARHVYAVEVGDIGAAAEANFAQNGFADRTTLVRGWSSEVTLPERADVLITETLGNDPLGERTLEIIRDARQRLLVPTPRIVPHRVRIYGLPVAFPEGVRREEAMSAENVANWRDWYGFDFSALGAFTGRSAQSFLIKSKHTKTWPVLADPVLFADLDLTTFDDTSVRGGGVTTATAAGELGGILVYFETDLGGGVELSVRPDVAPEGNSWSHQVWLPPAPLTVAPGDRLRLDYAYHVPGVRGGAHVERA